MTTIANPLASNIRFNFCTVSIYSKAFLAGNQGYPLLIVSQAQASIQRAPKPSLPEAIQGPAYDWRKCWVVRIDIPPAVTIVLDPITQTSISKVVFPGFGDLVVIENCNVIPNLVGNYTVQAVEEVGTLLKTIKLIVEQTNDALPQLNGLVSGTYNVLSMPPLVLAH